MIKLQSIDSSQFLGKPFSKGKHTIGRSHANDFEISTSSVSRRHAMLDIRDNNQIYLTDLNSRNGTKVNGDLISGTVQLAIGDEVTFGDVTFEVVTADTGGPTRDTLDKFDTGETEESSIVLPFDEARRQLAGIFNNPRTSQALCEIGRVVVDSDNLDIVLMKSLKLLHRAVMAERVMVLTANSDQTVSVDAGYPSDAIEVRKFSVSRTIVNEVLSKQVAIVVVDTRCDSRFTENSPSVEAGLRSIMAVPLIEQDAVSGILYADSTLAGIKFTEDHLRAFAAFGDILAAKLENCRLIRDKQQKAVLETELRVSQQKREELAEANQMLRETQSQLLQSEKMAALGRLVAGIVHELNSPLGAVQSNADLLSRLLGRISTSLEKNPDSPSDVLSGLPSNLRAGSDALRTMNTGVSRVLDVIQSLKLFAGLTETDWKMASVNELIGSAVCLVKPELGCDCAITTNLGDVPEILCSPALLNQVFYAVLANAAEAIPENGSIDIRAGVIDQLVRVTIVDNGCGISDEDQKRIFDLDFTTKDGRIRMGLGLATSLQIVQQHGGSITIKSEPGQGTTVTIDLPRNPPRRTGKKK